MALMKITDMHFDLLKTIMIFVSISSDGAADLARAISVCKRFMNLAEDLDVLRAVNFENVKLADRYELFQHINGLLYRCAQAGNETAQYMLAKTVLVSSSQLWSRGVLNDGLQCFGGLFAADKLTSIPESENHTRAAAFMTHFMEDLACNSSVSRGSLHHSNLVRLFLCRSSPRDLVVMRSHLKDYFKFFFGSVAAWDPLFGFINRICVFYDIIQCFEDNDDDDDIEQSGVVIVQSDILFDWGREEVAQVVKGFTAQIESFRGSAISIFDEICCSPGFI